MADDRPRLPNLFLIGAPKSGTTSMYEYLAGHPQAYLPDFKEPSYFAPDLAFDKSTNFLRHPDDEDAYRALFAEAGDAAVIGEGSTRYLYSTQAPRLIREAAPAARIVAMLRNPVDMIHSLHLHKLAAGTEDVTDFALALEAEPERHAGRRIPADSNPRLATYRDRARYGEQLRRWLDVFPRDQVHVIIFEEFAADPASHFRRLLELLGIDAAYAPASFAPRNVAHGTRSRSLRRVMNTPPVQWLAWRFLPRVLGDRRARRLTGSVTSRLHRRPVERRAVPIELRRRLEAEFRPDVELLSDLLERDMAGFWFDGTGGVRPTAR